MKHIKLIFINLLILFAISLKGQTVTTLYGPEVGINDDIHVLADGSIIGTDHSGTEVYKVSPTREVTILASGINAPNGLEVDGEGNIFICAPKEDKIYKLTPGGELTQYGPDISNPNNIIFKKNSDTFIVTDYTNSKLYELASDGTVTSIMDGLPLNGPLGMTYDDTDQLYIANFTDGKIFKLIDNQLEEFATVPGQDIGGLVAAIGYIIFHDGTFYATGFGKNRVYKISRTGFVSTFCGSGIHGSADGTNLSSSFSWPNGIAVSPDGNKIYISDYDTHNVRVITDFVTGVDNEPNQIITEYYLHQNYPNPFNPSTLISFDLAETSNVTLEVYDVLGNKVSSLIDGTKEAGIHNAAFSAEGLAGGVYFYRIQTDKYIQSRKMLYLK